MTSAAASAPSMYSPSSPMTSRQLSADFGGRGEARFRLTRSPSRRPTSGVNVAPGAPDPAYWMQVLSAGFYGPWRITRVVLDFRPVEDGMTEPRASEARRWLAELAGNLRWTWNGEFDALFREIDGELWREVNHNPAAFLAAVAEDRIDSRAADGEYLRKLEGARRALREDLLDERHWAGRNAPALGLHP